MFNKSVNNSYISSTSKKLYLYELLLVSILVSVLHFIALKFYLYWSTNWFDVLMHFLGGLVIGLIALYLIYSFSISREYSEKHGFITIVHILSLVLVVGLMWELWELFMGFSLVLEDLSDTILDLIMDTLGGLFAFLYSRIKINL